MSFIKGLQCKECNREFAADRRSFCEECLGPLEVVYDYDGIGSRLDPGTISGRDRNLWRYRELLPITGDPVTGFHSGFTPLIHARRLGERIGAPELFIKDDSTNRPSLSYKDRVVSVAVTRGRELGFTSFACASTGNLANSLAAHCAAAGFPCHVFVPSDIESQKIVGSRIYQPVLVGFDGNYDQVNRLCSEIGEGYGWGFVNVNLRPYYTEGAKTFGYEIAEQLGWSLPDHVVLPTAGGTLLPKVAKAFRELRRIGWLSGDCQIHCAQAAGCDPVVAALHAGAERVDPRKPDTLAKSIAIGDPADGPYTLQEIRKSGGWGESASDHEIVEAIKLLAASEGIFTEPAGGATLAVTLKLIRQGRIDRESKIVVGITGNGYKALDVFSDIAQVGVALRPNLQVFRAWQQGQAEKPKQPVAVRA